jgi:hypothetical protein
VKCADAKAVFNSIPYFVSEHAHIYIGTYLKLFTIFLKKQPPYVCVPWLDTISRPLASISPVGGGENTTRPRRQGQTLKHIKSHDFDN